MIFQRIQIFLVTLLTISNISRAFSGEQIILDVDPGIDDFQALVVLLNADNQRLVKIEAIVVSDGNTIRKNGIVNTFRILQAANRLDIPVYAGSYSPILPHYEESETFFGKDGFGDLQWTTKPPVHLLQKTMAHQMTKELVERYPGQITYMALGPTTNLALSLRLFEGLGAKLKAIYLMGGLTFNFTDTGEFNVKHDPEAAEIVFATAKCPISVLTFEACATDRPKLFWFEDAQIHNPMFRILWRVEEAFAKLQPEVSEWTRCDPLTAVMFLNKNVIAKSEINPLQVVLEQGSRRGVVETYDGEFTRQNVTAVMLVDFEQVNQMFLRAFNDICDTNPKGCVTVRD